MINLLADYTYTTTTTTSSNGSALGWLSGALLLPLLAVIVVMIVGMWKTFTKAGKPGWASIVPFYNMWVMAEIAGKPGWWGFLPLVAVVPFVGWIASVIVSIILALGTARNFGKSDVFGVIGLWLFAPIGYCILGFGNATYKGTNGAAGGPGTPSQSAPTPPSSGTPVVPA